MADVFDKHTRSRIMASIKAKDTKPEVLVRKFLFSKGLRFRKNPKNILGKPDIVLKKHNTIVFINGCFWHAHQNCSRFVMPKTRVSFWENKFEKNKSRDKKNIDFHRSFGWNVIVVWECDIIQKKEETLKGLLKSILST
jgi:DNA mismatch endonuclease (patch repair protein)